MEIEFWQQRWQQDQIAFHLAEVNPLLSRFCSVLNLPSDSEIFVPLCGKSLDLAWLASSGFSVLGIECSERAVNDFFNNQVIAVETHQTDTFNVYQSGNVKILHGDFFALDRVDLKSVKAVYDRASLVALPENLRQKYVDLLTDLLAKKMDILLITLEYNQSKMNGPPFSVSQNEVMQLYKPAFDVELIDQQDVLDEYPKFKERGLDYLTECVYRISR